MKSFVLRLFTAGYCCFLSLPLLADVTLTGFTTTSSTAGGVGDVTITFTTDDANFGGAQNGGWYVRAILPAGMSTNNAYPSLASCANSTINLSPALVPKTCGAPFDDITIIVSNTNPGVSQVLGAGTYSVTINDVTNPNIAGQVSLQQLDLFDATTGGVSSNASGDNLAAFSIAVSAASAEPVPVLPFYLLLTLSAIVGLLGLRKFKKLESA